MSGGGIQGATEPGSQGESMFRGEMDSVKCCQEFREKETRKGAFSVASRMPLTFTVTGQVGRCRKQKERSKESVGGKEVETTQLGC